MRILFKIVWYHIRLWKKDLRILAAFLLGIGVCIKNISPYIILANELEYSVQVFEPYIILGSRVPYLMGICLGGLLLLSDAPFITNISCYEVVRVGRRKWILSQIIYVIISCILYMVVICFMTILVTMIFSQFSLKNHWGNAMNMVAIKQSEFIIRKFSFSFPFSDFIEKTTPQSAFFITYIFNTAYLTLMGLCILMVNLVICRNNGWIITTMLYIISYIIYANGGMILPLKYSLLCCAAPAYCYIAGLGITIRYVCIVFITLFVIFINVSRYSALNVEFIGRL